MEWLSWILLGILQGLTEFLPVSSSGHLVLAQALLGAEAPGVLLEITVHAATAAAVVVLFAREVAKMIGAVLRWPLGARGARSDDGVWRRLAANILLATLATSVIGFGLEPFFRGAFETPVVAASMLLVTGLVLLLSSRLPAGRRPLESMGPQDSLWVGVAQGLAILPGLSRSGLTIVGGLTRGLEGRAAARFSFLLSLPAIAGAGLVEILRTGALSPGAVEGAGSGPAGPGLLLAAGAAFVAGLAAMVLLVRIVEKGGLGRFAWYCFAAGLGALVWLLA